MSSGPKPGQVLQDADVRMGFTVQEIYCSCTERGRGQELAKRAVSCDRALMPLNGKGRKEEWVGRSSDCSVALRKAGFLLPPLSVSPLVFSERKLL